MAGITKQRDIIDRRALAEELAQAIAAAPAAGLDRGVLLPPLKRAIEAEDVALAVIACVTHLTHTTGSIISVDAGRHL